jgi:hypothetical protein
MRYILLLLTAVVSSCVGPVSYTDTVYPPTNPAQIEVIHLNQIQRPYDIIGECRGDVVLHSAKDLKKMAAKLGADAISIPERDQRGYIIAQALKWKR